MPISRVRRTAALVDNAIQSDTRQQQRDYREASRQKREQAFGDRSVINLGGEPIRQGCPSPVLAWSCLEHLVALHPQRSFWNLKVSRSMLK
jgi:hypothetical protein